MSGWAQGWTERRTRERRWGVANLPLGSKGKGRRSSLPLGGFIWVLSTQGRDIGGLHGAGGVRVRDRGRGRGRMLRRKAAGGACAEEQASRHREVGERDGGEVFQTTPTPLPPPFGGGFETPPPPCPGQMPFPDTPGAPEPFRTTPWEGVQTVAAKAASGSWKRRPPPLNWGFLRSPLQPEAGWGERGGRCTEQKKLLAGSRLAARLDRLTPPPKLPEGGVPSA